MIEFEVNIKPHGKQRPRVCKNGITFTPKATIESEMAIRKAFIASGNKKSEGVVKISVLAVFEPPKSLSKTKKEKLIGTYYCNKPDSDNIFKEVADALNNIAFDDDKIASSIHCNKIYGRKNCLIIRIEEPKIEGLYSEFESYKYLWQ